MAWPSHSRIPCHPLCHRCHSPCGIGPRTEEVGQSLSPRCLRVQGLDWDCIPPRGGMRRLLNCCRVRLEAYLPANRTSLALVKRPILREGRSFPQPPGRFACYEDCGGGKPPGLRVLPRYRGAAVAAARPNARGHIPPPELTALCPLSLSPAARCENLILGASARPFLGCRCCSERRRGGLPPPPRCRASNGRRGRTSR